MNSMGSIFKTEIIIYHSKANLDEGILSGKITRIQTQKLGKCWKGPCLGIRIPHSILVHNLHAIDVKILTLKLTM